MALRTRKVGSNSTLPAKPKRIWVKVVPLVAALMIGGGVAAKAVFSGKSDAAAEVLEKKKTLQEIRKEERIKRQKAKVEMLKRVTKVQMMRERGQVSWGGEDEEKCPEFDEDAYGEALGRYKKSELWKLFSEQNKTVEHLEGERNRLVDGMELELSTGKRFPSEEEEKEEKLIVAKLGIEMKKQGLVQKRIDEIDLSEYELAGKGRDELQEILFSLEEKTMSWEDEQTMYLASVALHRTFWNDVWGKD
ncbi:MAG: hypothetical protein GY852_03090 [bacterium]|nr:hypothetical protein [bacterium]